MPQSVQVERRVPGPQGAGMPDASSANQKLHKKTLTLPNLSALLTPAVT